MTQKNKKSILGIATVSAVLLMLMLCITPVSAIDDAFSDYKQTYVEVSNYNDIRFDDYGDYTYYFIFNKAGGGYKSMHITNNTGDLDGDVYSNQGYSDTLYISDTSTDTEYHDNILLMFAVPSDASYSNLQLKINSSGYVWDPTGDGTKPSLTNNDYYENRLSTTLTSGDFLAGTSEWRLASDSDYPFYNNQNMSLGDQYKVMLIDTNVGTLNDTASNLIDSGMATIDYEITGYSGEAIFDVYAYCNQSKRGQGVSWTNKLSDILGGNSGWTIDF